MNRRLNEYHQSEPFKAFYSKHEKQLQQVFKFYKENQNSEYLTFKSFMTFAAQFNIFPSLLPPEQLNLIFRSLTKEHRKALNVLSYDEFLQGLLRIAVKSQSMLAKLYERYKNKVEGEVLGAKEHEEMYNIINKTKKEEGQESLTKDQENQIKADFNYEMNIVAKDKEDEYQKIELFTPEIMEGLMIFLDLPSDIKALGDKLRSLQRENQKLAPRDKKRAAMSLAKGGSPRSQSPSNFRSF